MSLLFCTSLYCTFSPSQFLTRMIICKHKNHFMYLFERHFVVFFEHSIHGIVHLKNVATWLSFYMSRYLRFLKLWSKCGFELTFKNWSNSYSFRWTNPTYTYKWKGCLKEMEIPFCFLLFLQKIANDVQTASFSKT